MSIESVTHVDNVKLSEDGRAVVIIDQSLLPNETVYLTLDKAEDLWEAIYSLRVQGRTGNRNFCRVCDLCAVRPDKGGVL